MNTVFIILAVLLATAIAVLLVTWARGFNHRRGLVSAVNIAEGTHAESNTYTVEEVFGSPFLLAKLGTVAGDIGICDAADTPFGVAQDDPDTIGKTTAVEFLGKGRTKLGIADAAITRGALLVPADGGEVRDLPAAAATYWVIGRALHAQATVGGKVEYMDCFPYQVTVS